jgi:hypothetical protein
VEAPANEIEESVPNSFEDSLRRILCGLWVPASALAQNCALCYTQAAGAGQRIIEALRSGIFILVVPRILICTALTVMAYRKRNHFAEE